MNDNVCFILLGASGDLAKRKIIPALYRLIQEKKLTNIAIVGAASHDITPAQILEYAKPFIATWDDAVTKNVVSRFYYQSTDFAQQEAFNKLAALIVDVEKKHKLSGDRVIYCAIPPHLFCQVSARVSLASIIKRGATQPFNRIVFEKPFGSNFTTAVDLNACLKQLFDESQIVRVDHYLSKELVGNIALIRFTNSIFEPLWNAQFIDSVHIVLSETVGLEGRGIYYDEYGVLKDVVQNHMLQLLSLVAMEAPQELSGDSIRNEKTKVLSCVKPVGGMLGQYQGYQQEKGVSSQSKTATFAALELRINNERWNGVPFYLSTGKCLDKKETAIRIKFKTRFCALKESSQCEPNILTISIAPETGFSLQLNAKKPGELYKVTPVTLDFCHSCVFPDIPADYETMLYEIISGDQSISVRFDTIEYAWKIVDEIEAMRLPLYEYKQGSKGPEQAVAWSAHKGISW